MVYGMRYIPLSGKVVSHTLEMETSLSIFVVTYVDTNGLD